MVARTRKGDRAAQSLKESARTVFRDSGFNNARVQDIAAGASLSIGAYYRYYKDKHDILVTLLRDLLEQAFVVSRSPWDAEDPMRSINATTLRYLEFYETHADLFRVLIEVSQTDVEVEAIWAEVRQHVIDRISVMLRRAVPAGLVRADLDIEVSATLLAAMTDHYAYLRFVVNRAPERELDDVSRQIALIWAHGVFLGDPSPAPA
jgi:AcrR family transcriptional regulator